MGLVTASGSPYRDGTFLSCTNWDDYTLWCLVVMQEDCVQDQLLKAASKAAVKPATTAGVEEEKEEVLQPRATKSTTTVPSGLFFRQVLVSLRGRFGDISPFVQGKV